MDRNLIRIDIEVVKIDCVCPGRTRWGRRHGGCGHVSSGRKNEGAEFLQRRGRRSGKGIGFGLVDSGRCSGHRVPSGAGGWFVERVAGFVLRK